MDINLIKANAATLQNEMQWLAQIIDTRITLYTGLPSKYKNIEELTPPDLSNNISPYAATIKEHSITYIERIVLLLALAPHIQPQLLDVLLVKNADYDKLFTEFGGVKGVNHCGFIPTGETAAFIIAINNFENRFILTNMFSEQHFFKKHGILNLSAAVANEPILSGTINITPEYLNCFTQGTTFKPNYNTNFPAKQLTTERKWEDLVLEDSIMDNVNEIKDWIQYGDILLNKWDMKAKIKPGFRSLFYGPPGTGKTFTATLIGKATGLYVYQIDLSMIVSKFIGETEKNLASLFDQAQNKNWILFFDEADALFGKRTQTSSSNDRYANQEVSYLLQRIEDFPGVVILATNLKVNLDEAFSRRFQSMIYFPLPGAEQRKLLWHQAFSQHSVFEQGINIDEIAQKYEIAGGAIINISRYCSLKALKRNSQIILKKDIIMGIKREFLKEGKTVLG